MKKIILILAILLVSCGSRKVNKSQVDIKQDVVQTTKDFISISTDIKQTVIDTSTCDEITYEPIVDSLPFIVNSKVFKNVKIKTRKVKSGISVLKKENRSTQSLKINQKEIKTDIKEDEKQIYKEPATSWWVLWILLLVGILLTWYEYKK